MATLDRLNALEDFRETLRDHVLFTLQKGEWMLQTRIREAFEARQSKTAQRLLDEVQNPRQRLVMLFGDVLRDLCAEGRLEGAGWGASRAYRLKKKGGR